MKKRIFKAMWLSVMAVAVVTVSSCSSDDIKENIYNDNTLFYLSKDPKYIDYVESSLLYENAIKDTTNMTLTAYLGNNKAIYSKDIEYSYTNVINAYENFVDYYPQYLSMSVIEQNKLYNHCVNINPRLRELTDNKNFLRTKSGNPETSDAYNAVMYKHAGDHVLNGVFAYSDSYLIKVTTASAAKYMAVQETISKGVERGGFVWNDDSGCLFTDKNASSSSMGILFFDWGPYVPSYSFHVHTSSSTGLSDADILTLANSSAKGVNKMLILSTNGSSKMHYAQ